jgi:putative redox protein
LVFGSSVNGDAAFTPVELLLTAVAGCTAADVDFIVSKRAEPSRFEVSMTAEKVRDDQGNHLRNLVVRFDVAFASDETGESAREVLPAAVQRSHDFLCTVSRTIELGTPVEVVL